MTGRSYCGLTSCNPVLLTVTVRDFVADPPGPVQVRTYVVVAVGETTVLPLVPTLPMLGLTLHEVAPDDAQVSVAVIGGTMGPVADDAKEEMTTGGGATQAAAHCAWVVDVGVVEKPQV
jgi:hypothetical protein